MKSARDSNTTSYWSKSVFRMFIDGKLFIGDNGVSHFDSPKDAWTTFFMSNMWIKIREYVDYSQAFFDKQNDNDWRTDFEERILTNLNISIKEYKCDD